MSALPSKVGSGDIAHHLTPPPSHSSSKLKPYGFIIAIIAGMAVVTMGLIGYFHVGTLSNMSQVDAILMMVGSGTTLLIIVQIIKNQQIGLRQKHNHVSNGSRVIETGRSISLASSRPGSTTLRDRIPVKTSVRSLNIFEQAECLIDSAAKGNLNFSIVSTYTGKLNSKTVRAGIKYLQQMHPLLRMSPNAVKKITAFIETSPEVPFKKFSYTGKEQWRSVVKEELAPRFNRIDQPLWRVCLLKGKNTGQLIITFHHAIADGVCAMRMMNHLFQILAQLIKGQTPRIEEFNTPVPDIHSLYPLTSEEPADDLPITLKKEGDLSQDFATHVIDEVITKKIIDWSKQSHVKVHAILFAAFLMSVKQVLKPDFEKFCAVTAVNYRSSFTPAFSHQVLALMRTLISEEFSISETSQLQILAQEINQSVHSQLDAGKHILNLKGLEKRLSRNISAEELLQRCKLPSHAVAQTNLGAMDFSGDYSDSTLRLEELFFFADTTPFFEGRTNLVLGTLSFRQKIFLCLWFFENLVSESEAKSILLKMKEILSTISVDSPKK